ncbi:MAG: RHS repeat-associated core domain-containing protein [Balneolaceae bacterium]|nr:MAG: RHS repeat-associated core domain-containing protein [Balneolaceae bacterium]
MVYYTTGHNQRWYDPARLHPRSSQQPAPVAVINLTPDKAVYYAGETIALYGGNSYVQSSGNINYYQWYINGELKLQGSGATSYNHTVIMETGSTEQTLTIRLRVRHSNHQWDSKTITRTEKQKPGQHYYLTDHLGSVRATVNAAGTLVGWDDFYPFGMVMPGRSSNTANPNDLYKFTGHERDREAGLEIDFMNARTYDSEIGRFMSVDPITHTLNPQELFEIHNGRLLWYSPYAYTFNDPIRFVDPDGRCPEPTNTDGKICIALFIQSESVLGLEGDNRDFSSSSDPSQSRLFLHIDVENQTFSVTVNETCSIGGNCADPAPTNQIDVVFGDDGGFSVSVEAKNSLRPRSSPAIDASFTFTPDGSGGFTTSGNRDAFPSAEAYLWRGGQPTTLFQRTERTPFHLFPLMPKDRWPR